MCLAFSKLQALSCWLYFALSAMWIQLFWVIAKAGGTVSRKPPEWLHSQGQLSTSGSSASASSDVELARPRGCAVWWLINSVDLSRSRGTTGSLWYPGSSQTSKPGVALLVKAFPAFSLCRYLPDLLLVLEKSVSPLGSHSIISFCCWSGTCLSTSLNYYAVIQ